MNNRDGMRPRQIDDNKPFQVIKDIENAKKTLPAEDKKELEKIEIYLQKVINHFANKKKIIIPKSNNIENNNLNNNEKNEKNEKAEKSEKKKQNINNIQSDIPKYELKEYKRPDNYIIYSSKERDNPKAKDYEAKYSDRVFLNYHGDFMKIEVLEDIISTLENNIGKGEKIPDEMAKKIIEENFSKYKSKSDLIINHFNDRRNELKKSLLRKYWRLQKSTDKYFTSTFRRREREKMKIRKNNQKKEESFEKVKIAGEFCKNYLLTIINAMKDKEDLNKKKSLLDNIIFMSEIKKVQNQTIPIEYINQNNEIISSLKEKGITINETSLNIDGEKEKINENDPFKRDGGTPSTKDDNNNNNREELKKKDEELYIKDINIIPQELVYPPINIGFLRSEKIVNNNKYRVRIRFNRNKKITVDRYIQKGDSMDPFDDSFNEKIMKYQKYEPKLAINSINNNSFESLIQEFYSNKYKYLSFFEDNDDINETLLKNKKSNKRFINKKRNFNK